MRSTSRVESRYSGSIDAVVKGHRLTQAGPSGSGRGVSQRELETRLWAAANSLHGPVDPSDFKAFIFPLLFFRRVSDTWDEEHKKAGEFFTPRSVVRVPTRVLDSQPGDTVYDPAVGSTRGGR